MVQKTWAVGEEVLAADFQSYLQDQVVAQFPNVAARNTWAAPPKGALCVTTDTNTPWIYGGSNWQVLSGVPMIHAEMTGGEVGWTAAAVVVLDTAQAFTTSLGNRYAVTVDIDWRGTVLADVHQFELVRGNGPGGDFTTSTVIRSWVVSPSRATVSGSSEHFFAQHILTVGVATTNKWRIRASKLGGTGSGYVTDAALDFVARHIPGQT